MLTYDMVFVPRLELARGLLGLEVAVPRAVPADLLVALASRVVPADLLQKLLLAGIFVGAAAGAARLVPARGVAARAAAAVLYAWNPFVYERLLMGHWALLVSYAALPWVVAAAVDLRNGRGGAARLVVTLAVAAFGSPAGGLIAAGTAICVVASPPWRQPAGHQAPADAREAAAGPAVAARRAALVLGVALVVSAPWLVPSLLRPGGLPVRPEGTAAFASRPDGPLGTVGSLLGLGGIWNAFTVPPGLGSWPWLAGFAVVLAVAAAGLPLLPRRLGTGAAAGVLLAGGLGLLLAAAYALPGLRVLVDLAVQHLPGGGLLRDAQKFVAPLALLEAVAFGLGVERLPPMLPARRRAAATVVLILAPLLLLPALAWGAAGRLAAVPYPRAFQEARAAMAADQVQGAVLVLPWHLYLAFPWNGDRVVLGPAQRWFTRRAVGNDDLELVGLTVPGEDPYGTRLGPLVGGTAPLRPALPAAGICYVLVFKVGDWSGYLPRLAGLVPVLDRAELALYRVPASPSAVRFATPPVAPVVAADLLAVALVLWALAGLSLPAGVRQLVSSGRSPPGGRR
ncbi:MAG TPA: hypothetical protein VGR68_07680 [Actinomycetota bacterium]|nr:hypothetical protein [Actinomycetota bacterium]